MQILRRPLDQMEDTLAKQKDQTVWYENNERIKEYLESSEKSSRLNAVSTKEKVSLTKLIKAAMADQVE